jgi:hypothetical protein
MRFTSRLLFFISPLFVLYSFSFSATAQSMVKLKFVDATTQKAIGNVTVRIPVKSFNAISSNSGSLNLSIIHFSNADTIEFSCVGYRTLKTSIGKIQLKPVVLLEEDAKDLENIIIKNYLNTSETGSREGASAHFKSWFAKKNSGEIGRIMYVKNEDFKLEKVRFKINNQCDTCVLRLHVRRLKNGIPEDDLLKDSISIVSNRLSFDDKFIEFDLNPYDVIIKKNKYIFVSLETLYCSNIDKSTCSLAFIGTEDGNFLYRTRDYRDWEEDASHSLYLKIYFKF